VRQNFSSLISDLGKAAALIGMVWLIESLGGNMPTTFLSKISPLSWSVQKPINLFTTSFKAAAKLQELELKYGLALSQISDLEHLAEENQELHDLLKTYTRNEAKFLIAEVISYGQPSVSVGEAVGVKVGQPVLVSKNLVGLIDSVDKHHAQVKLLAQNKTTPILAQTQSGLEGLVVGDGRNILLTQLPQSAAISPGEKVTTVGQSQISPKIMIGEVEAVFDQPAAATKQAVISQVVSFYTTPTVEVLP
jgi:cell shape-determining protein MreC